MVQLKIWTRLGPTENSSYVLEALEKFFPDIEFKADASKKRVEGKGRKRRLLDDLRHKIWNKQVLDTSREMMLGRMDGDLTNLMIHKQAAYVGKLVLVNRDEESPLGAIHIEIQSNKLEELIDWLSPETIKGKPIEGFSSVQKKVL